MAKLTPRTMEVLCWVRDGSVRQSRFPGSTYTSWTTVWGQSGTRRNVSDKEIQKLIDAGLVTHHENKTQWTQDTQTGERAYHHIAVLTAKGEHALED